MKIIKIEYKILKKIIRIDKKSMRYKNHYFEYGKFFIKCIYCKESLKKAVYSNLGCIRPNRSIFRITHLNNTETKRVGGFHLDFIGLDKLLEKNTEESNKINK